MVEHGGGIEQNFKKEDAEGRRADGGDRTKFDGQREENFDRMKARASSDIDIEVGVVHAMEPPKDRLVMKKPVLEVDDEVEYENGSNNGNPARDRHHIE